MSIAFNRTYRQAIVTSFHGPTNTLGSRISATAPAGRVYVPYDHSFSSERNHELAAEALCEKFGWVGVMVSGGIKDGDRVHCFVETTQEAADRLAKEVA